MFFLYFLLLSDNKNKTPELQKKLRQVSRLFPAIKSRRFQLKWMPRPRFSLSQVLIGMNRGECGGADEECGCVGGSFLKSGTITCRSGRAGLPHLHFSTGIRGPFRLPEPPTAPASSVWSSPAPSTLSICLHT